jgi:hypothetical protein
MVAKVLEIPKPQVHRLVIAAPTQSSELHSANRVAGDYTSPSATFSLWLI